MSNELILQPHNVMRENSVDGSIILRSGQQQGLVVETTCVWLKHWAKHGPNRIFLAERSGAGWRGETYSSAFEKVLAIASALVARGLNAATPIAILSGNSIDHGLLVLAAQYVGVPTVTLAEQYAVIAEAHPRLVHAIDLVKPKMAYVSDAQKFALALALPAFADVEIVASAPAGQTGVTDFADLLKGANADLVTVHRNVGPDTIAKILLTSGSTGSPKGVLTTQRMLCVNQTQITDAYPFIKDHPPQIVDWLPWNHVFGGSHNFNLVLANGGSLYIDDGKPLAGPFQRTIENLRMVKPTIAFNVPVGFSMLLQALKNDIPLQHQFFSDLDFVFYAGASLPQDVWDGFAKMAAETGARVPLMATGWGLTEGGPSCTFQHEASRRTGEIGVPVTGVEIKLIADEAGRYEARVKGPNVTPGYFNAPEATAAAFDEEGYFITGDAFRIIDENRLSDGLRFDGRISEDFKLVTGTWVRATNLRLDLLAAIADLAFDIVLTGIDRNEIGVLIFPRKGAVADGMSDGEVYSGTATFAPFKKRLAELAATASGTSQRIGRAMLMAEPASLTEGEMTAKGNLNFRRILTRRAAIVNRLYDDADLALIRV
ncbi:MAG: AMP-binding protein [Aestuariivirga sp.]